MAIKGRILTRFPMRIVGAPGTDLSYENGVLTIDVPTPGLIEVLEENLTITVDPLGTYTTLQAAWDYTTTLDANGFDITIQVPDGTDTVGLHANSQARNAGTITVQGNHATPANCKITKTSGQAMLIENGVKVSIDGFELSTITAGNSLYVRDRAQVDVYAIRFGACATSDCQAENCALVTFRQSYTKFGNAVAHYHIITFAQISAAAITITHTGTPAYSSYFVGLAAGFVSFASTVFTGAATGIRYYVHYGATISTTNQTLPGSIAGVNLGGNYDDRILFYGSNDDSAPTLNQVGQVITSSVAAGAAGGLLSTVAGNITFIDLTPGIWDVVGTVSFTPNNTTSITNMRASVSTTSVTIDTTMGHYARRDFTATGQVLGFADEILNVAPVRFLVAAGTTTRVYLVCDATFTISTMTVGGCITARRPA